MKTIKQREQDQIDYVADLVKNPKKNLLAATINQIISMRSSGYTSTAYVFGDLIDNSIEAGASKIIIDFDKSLNKILVIDDGMGMQPELISHAMTYGGTHRHGSETCLASLAWEQPMQLTALLRKPVLGRKRKGLSFIQALSVSLSLRMGITTPATILRYQLLNHGSYQVRLRMLSSQTSNPLNVERSLKCDLKLKGYLTKLKVVLQVIWLEPLESCTATSSPATKSLSMVSSG